MNRWVKDALKVGLLDVQCEREEMTQILGMVQRFTELLPQRLGVEEIAQKLVRIIIEETSFENCSIVLWDDAAQRLSLLSAFGLQDLLGGGAARRYNGELHFAVGSGIAYRVFASRNPVFIEDAAMESIPARADAVIQPVSLACLPVLDLGVLNLSSYRPRQFSSHLKHNWEFLSKMIGYLILQATFHSKSEKIQPDAQGNGNTDNGASRQKTRNLTGAGRLTEQIIDRTPQGLCLLDPNGNVVRINKSVIKLHGGDISGVIGRSPSVFFHDPQLFQSLFQKVSVEGQTEIADVSLVSASGKVYLADVHLAMLTDNEGMVTGYLLVINDTTKKKAFAEKFLQTEKLAALGTMAGGVAHDFNNLLMAILGNIQMILHQTTDENVRRRLQNVERAVHDGAHTVRRLQKFTERDRDHQVLVAPVDVSEAIKDVVELTRPRWKNAMEKFGHTIKFGMELEPHCLALIHASDLREVLTNLIFNAIEAMPQGGTLTLRSRSSREWIVIEVADTGIGMSEEVARKIFDPFYTTKGVGNSGLGLSVSWSLVSRCGGEIQVNSKPGKGSTFEIKLPKGEAQVSVPDVAKMTPESGQHRLLVVDDDMEVLGILRDMLRLKGHRVTATDDGERALDLIERESFDLVLTDLGMPVVSGWDIAKRVKARDPDIPVILITGWGTQYEEEDLSKHGIDLVLPKPLSWEKLLGTVGKLLSPP